MLLTYPALCSCFLLLTSYLLLLTSYFLLATWRHVWKYGERPGALGYNPHCAFAPYVCTYCKCGDFLKEAARCSFCVVLMAERVWCFAHLERYDWARSDGVSGNADADEPAACAVSAGRLHI